MRVQAVFFRLMNYDNRVKAAEQGKAWFAASQVGLASGAMQKEGGIFIEFFKARPQWVAVGATLVRDREPLIKVVGNLFEKVAFVVDNLEEKKMFWPPTTR